MLKKKEVRWKEVEGYPIKIEVSEDGRARKWIDNSTCVELKVNKTGKYSYVCFCGKQIGIHRLVAQAFVPNPNDFPLVRFKDNDSNNNAASNLEWVQRGDDTRRAYAEGSNNKVKIYCEETKQLFSSMRTAVFSTGVPHEFITHSIKSGKSVCGFTFKNIDPSDKMIQDLELLYVTFDEACKIAECTSTTGEFQETINSIFETRRS